MTQRESYLGGWKLWGTKVTHKIALLGPESSGKSTLCLELSSYFGTAFVPEFAREFVSGLHRALIPSDLLHIADAQISSEEAASRQNRSDRHSGPWPQPGGILGPESSEMAMRLDSLLAGNDRIAGNSQKSANLRNVIFCDTEMIYLKVWSEYEFGGCSQALLERVEKQRYGFYLLTKPDIPWVDDGIRKLPDLREEIFERYRSELIALRRPFEVVEGIGQRRVNHAIESIDSYLDRCKNAAAVGI